MQLRIAIRTVLLSSAFGLTAQNVRQAHEPAPIRTTICELSRNPGAFDNKLVAVHAEFESDGIERSILTDKSCSDRAVLPYDPGDAKGIKSLDEALATGHPGTLDKTIAAKFTGVFHYAGKAHMCNFFSKELCRRSLKITEVSDLILTMKQTSTSIRKK